MMTIHNNLLPLVVSAGEPAGIGPEIIAAAWQHCRATSNPKDEFIVIGDADLLARRGNIPTQPLAAIGQDYCFTDALPVLHRAYAAPVIDGTPDKRNAPMVQAAIEQAAMMCYQGFARAMVTAPIDKHILHTPNFPFHGHTDYLEQLDQRHTQKPHNAVMMMSCGTLRCVPVSVHVALAQAVAQLDSRSIIKTVTVLAKALRQQFGIVRPRIAVSGLNPHAGENGLMGDEEQHIIVPAIAQLSQQHPNCLIEGPFPADSLFIAPLRERYDCFVCMYHDQALLPIKTLAFERAVNTTLGLSLVRTSPDHGTAYDLVGSDQIDSQSMIAAITQAAQLTGS